MNLEEKTLTEQGGLNSTQLEKTLLKIKDICRQYIKNKTIL